MFKVARDLSHFGTINVHEDELILESYKKKRTLDAIGKLERRLDTLWTRNEIKHIMHNLNLDYNKINNIKNQVKFLNKMVGIVTKGMRFSKHRKKGDHENRWVLIKNDRLYWKNGVTAENRKSCSFNFAKIIHIKPGLLKIFL